LTSKQLDHVMINIRIYCVVSFHTRMSGPLTEECQVTWQWNIRSYDCVKSCHLTMECQITWLCNVMSFNNGMLGHLTMECQATWWQNIRSLDNGKSRHLQQNSRLFDS